MISVLNHVLQWSLKPRYLIDMIQRCTSYICIVVFFFFFFFGAGGARVLGIRIKLFL